jgi:hypothetical protein
MQGANGKPFDPDSDTGSTADQDIDTAGTDADEHPRRSSHEL